MNAIEKAKNDVWLDNSWESDEIATRVMEILEQAARAYAVEELEKARSALVMAAITARGELGGVGEYEIKRMLDLQIMDLKK